MDALLYSRHTFGAKSIKKLRQQIASEGLSNGKIGPVLIETHTHTHTQSYPMTNDMYQITQPKNVVKFNAKTQNRANTANGANSRERPITTNR